MKTDNFKFPTEGPVSFNFAVPVPLPVDQRHWGLRCPLLVSRSGRETPALRGRRLGAVSFDRGPEPAMLKSADVEKLSAREIKQHLAAASIDFGDCFEKRDLIRRLQTHIAKESSDKALKAKASANHAYARGGYAVAVRHYQEGLALCVDNGSELAAQMRGNQSLAFLRMGQLLLARRAAEECLSHAPWFAKGYLRLGNAAAKQGDHKMAVRALRKGIEVAEGRAAEEEGGSGEATKQEGSGGDGGGEREGGGGQRPEGVQGAAQKLIAELRDSLRVSEAVVGSEVPIEPLAPEFGGGERGGGQGGAPLCVSYVGCALLEVVSEDLLVELMGAYLSAAVVFRVACTCRALRTVCVSGREKTTKLWQAVCERQWQGPARRVSMEGTGSVDWRSFCVERMCTDRRWAEGLADSKVSILKADMAPVFNVSMKGDLVVSAEDSRLRLWDLRLRSEEKALDCHNHGHRMVLGLWLDPVHDRALSGGADGDIRVWDLTSGSCTRVLTGHQASICSLVATEDVIVSTSFDGSSKVWNWQGRTEQTLLGHHGHVCGLSLQEGDHRRCWTGADDGLVKLWDMETAQCLESTPPQIGSVWCVKSETNALLTGCTDTSVRIFDPRSCTEVVHLPGHREAVAGLVSDEHKILTSAFDSTVRVWDRRTLRCRGVLSMPLAQREPGLMFHNHRRCSRLCMSESTVVVGSIDGCVYVIDVY